jgi:eukaryotic-like serine/threonine-protein kinase
VSTARPDELSSRQEPTGPLILGRYRLVKELAAGGMGVVSLARAEGAAGFVKPVVVKRILPHLAEDESMVRMFVREARILSNLQHPNIVSVLDFAQTEDAYVMVLEYIHGYSLASWRKFLRRTERSFPTEAAIHVVAEVLEAVHYAHTLKRADGTSAMVVHRDISPSNVLLDTHGHVKLTDFGIARMSSTTDAYRTSDNTVRGKFPYMAPELMSGGAPSARSDVYACGVVLHELLAGRNEFARPEVRQTILQVMQHELSALEGVRSDVPAGIDAIVAKAVAKDPEARYASAAAFLADLRALRQLSEEEAMADLAERTRSDFFGDMPSTLGLPPLPALEAAWRELTPEGAKLDPAVDITVDVEEDTHTTTLDKPPRPAAATGDRSRRPLWGMAVGTAVLLLTAAGVGAWFGGRGNQEEPESQYIVVEGERAAAAPETEIPETEPAPPAEESTEPQPARAEESPPPAEPATTETPKRSTTPTRARPAAGGARALTRRFERRRGEVIACFERHASDVSGQPQLSIRFSIDRAGTVEEADLLPSALSATALGRCLEQVAKRTSFGPQPEPLSFRIPIDVQRR